MRKHHNSETWFGMFTSLLNVSVWLILLLSSPYTFSGTFLPEVDVLRDASLPIKESHRQAVDSLLSSDPTTPDFYQIDDMRFKTNNLVQNNGFTGTRWTGGIVYYRFDANVNVTNQQRWLNAAAEWSAVANVTFVPRTTQTNYIHVQDDTGNWSYVGMIGGQQELAIFNWTLKFVIAHEIGHALGLSHEQSRSDRNSFVTIFLQNVQAGMEHNFDMLSTTNYGAYDFDSVMHYSRTAFSSNGLNTIEPLPAYSQWLNLIGQYTHLSVLDMSGMAARYGSVACNPDAFENDNNQGQAKTITPGVSKNHSICPVGDDDWSVFTLTADSEVTLATTGPAGNTRMWLRDSGGTQIEFNDDGGVDLFSLITRACNVDSLPAGTYFVEIDEFNDDAEILSYVLHLTVTGCVSCSYSVSPTGESFTSSGGSGSFSVLTTSGCNWTPIKSDSWITLTSGTGSGNGTVSYTVAANPGSTARSGTISVGGQTYDITQSGVPCNVNTVSGITENARASHEACETLVVGPSYGAKDGASVALSSGLEIEIMSGVLIEHGATLEVNVCGQSLCETSPSPMPYGCHSCVDQICDIDPACCNTEFNQACLDRVNTVCGLVCE